MSRRAFTMIELLLVTTLLAGISLAVFLCIANGLKLWQRTRTLMTEEDATLFLDRFSSECRNTFLFSTLAFKGEEHSIEFPSVVMVPADRAGSRAAEGYVDTIGRVRYAFDAATGELRRYQADYGRGVKGVWGDPRILASGLNEVKFKYFFPGSREYRTSAESKDKIPSGIEVDVLTGPKEEERVITRFLTIPLGS